MRTIFILIGLFMALYIGDYVRYKVVHHKCVSLCEPKQVLACDERMAICAEPDGKASRIDISK